MKRYSRRSCLWVLFACFVIGLAQAVEQGQSFTYQGQLRLGGIPVNGTRDLSFRLYDAATGGNPVGDPVSLGAVPVVDGLFTVELAFPGAFSGERRWLEVSVAGTALSPRQPVNAAPVALYALDAAPMIFNQRSASGTPGAQCTATACCLAGESVVSGGFAASSDDNLDDQVHVSVSAPVIGGACGTAQGWTIQTRNFNTGSTVSCTAHAVCAE